MTLCRCRKLAGLLGAAILATASQARAAIVEVSYVGTVYSSIDPTGLFGPAGNNTYVGAAFVANFTFNTSLGNVYTSSVENYALGGRTYGNDDPALSNNFSINGVLGTIANPDIGEILGYNNGSGNTEQYHTVEIQTVPVGLFSLLYGVIDPYFLGVNQNFAPLPASITTSFMYSPASGEYAKIGFETGIYDDISRTYTNYTEVDASISTLTVTATPLPSTWLAMLTGLMGFILFEIVRSGRTIGLRSG